MIILLDTNIWISLALNKQLEFIADLNKSNIVIASCDNLLDELITVLSRPKFKKYFSKNYLDRFIEFHQLTTFHFELASIVKIVTDEKDNYLFALCNSSNANYFVTGDKLLLEVKKYNKSSIITLATFKELIIK